MCFQVPAAQVSFDPGAGVPLMLGSRVATSGTAASTGTLFAVASGPVEAFSVTTQARR